MQVSVCLTCLAFTRLALSLLKIWSPISVDSYSIYDTLTFLLILPSLLLFPSFPFYSCIIFLSLLLPLPTTTSKARRWFRKWRGNRRGDRLVRGEGEGGMVRYESEVEEKRIQRGRMRESGGRGGLGGVVESRFPHLSTATTGSLPALGSWHAALTPGHAASRGAACGGASDHVCPALPRLAPLCPAIPRHVAHTNLYVCVLCRCLCTCIDLYKIGNSGELTVYRPPIASWIPSKTN